MKKEKGLTFKDDQGKGLAALSTFLIIIALILVLVLVDQCFVPSGETWEKLKADYNCAFEPQEKLSDAQIWEDVKERAFGSGEIKIHSGFLLWAWCYYNYQFGDSSAMLPPNLTVSSQNSCEPQYTEYDTYTIDRSITGNNYEPQDTEYDTYTIDHSVIENNFLGVWQSDEKTIIIGKNANYDAPDLFDIGYGIMDNAYMYYDQGVLTMINTSGVYGKIKVQKKSLKNA